MNARATTMTGTIRDGSRRALLLFAVALVLTVVIYWPGLGGGFVLDDYPNIVDNTALHLPDTSAASWIEALWASPSSELRRPLASLTFAANYAMSGLDPGPMKTFNLLVHVLNGLLLFVLMRRIVTLAYPGAAESARRHVLPALVAGIWLLHPINLTCVLYVVQRMESLANAFVLTALIVYVDARSQRFASRRSDAFALWIGVPLLTAIGVLAKESAVLVPLYALALELTLFHFADAPLDRRRPATFFVAFLALPAIVGLARILPRYLTPDAYAMRPFTLAERLLTEPRALADYVGWTVVPLPTSFSLYRDDFVVSQGLSDPWTTLPAILAIAAIGLAVVLLRRRRPLVALGLGWFLAAHALTATFIPLELVYEHRNYFASGGLLLALLDLLLPSSSRSGALPLARYAIMFALAALCSFSTALRAREWGNPIRFAMLEAARHPASPRATYGLGRTLLIASRYDTQSPALAEARIALERAARVPSASIMPYVALVQLASRTASPIERNWIDGMTEKLASHVPTIEDTGALRSLTDCVNEDICKLDDADLLHIYLAAVTHPQPDPSVLYSYAIFAFRHLHDTDLALELARAAADAPPVDPQYRLNLVNFLISLGRKDEAAAQLDRLKNQETLGRLSRGIADAERRLAALPPKAS